MFEDILMPVLTLSGVAVAAGYMLTALGNSTNDKFDERQLIERGRGANLSMNAAMMYLLGLYLDMHLTSSGRSIGRYSRCTV